MENQLQFEIERRKLNLLAKKLQPISWGSTTLALVFTLFFWSTGPKDILAAWLFVHIVTTLLRVKFLYPRYFQTDITTKNLKFWFNFFTTTVTLTGTLWAIGWLLFFTPDNTVLLLVLMFTFFTLVLSSAIATTSHAPVFFLFVVPITLSISWLFYSHSNQLHMGLGFMFLAFTITTISYYRIANQDITKLITLQLEKEHLAFKLKKERDIAEENRKIAEESVYEKSRFLAAASHDLRQPLHTTNLLLEVINQHILTEEGKEILQNIIESNRALGKSFNSLLDISKLNAGIVDVKLVHLSLQSIMEQLRAEFQHVAKEKGLTLNFFGKNLAVFSDHELLLRMLRNLVSNAIKYTKRGSIEVSWHECSKPDHLMLEISDTGIGIPDFEIGNIFSEYYQIHNSERSSSKGFGLGLAIVNGLSKLLDIDVNVESSLGKGTKFTLLLPEGALINVMQMPSSDISRDDLSGIRVLVIDDDENILRGMEKLLGSWKCRVFSTTSAKQAIKALSLKQQVPDIILSDYRLKGGENGINAIRAILTHLDKRVPALIITGDTSPERLKEVALSGFGLLHKPVEPAELRTFIQRQLKCI